MDVCVEKDRRQKKKLRQTSSGRYSLAQREKLSHTIANASRWLTISTQRKRERYEEAVSSIRYEREQEERGRDGQGQEKEETRNDKTKPKLTILIQ